MEGSLSPSSLRAPYRPSLPQCRCVRFSVRATSVQARAPLRRLHSAPGGRATPCPSIPSRTAPCSWCFRAHSNCLILSAPESLRGHLREPASTIPSPFRWAGSTPPASLESSAALISLPGWDSLRPTKPTRSPVWPQQSDPSLHRRRESSTEGSGKLACLLFAEGANPSAESPCPLAPLAPPTPGRHQVAREGKEGTKAPLD